MKGIVIYKSNYGATRQYAQWIGNDLNFAVVSASVVNTQRVKDADMVVIGSSIYMGKALIKGWLRRNKQLLAGKIIFIFLVSGTPVDHRNELEKYTSASIPASIRENIHLFFLPGKMIYQQLSWLHRITLQLGARLLAKNGQRNILQDYNEVRRNNITELVAAANAVILRGQEQPREPKGTRPFENYTEGGRMEG